VKSLILLKSLIFFVAGCVCALGADARVELPIMGYVVDSNSNAVRAVLGIPGASQMGAPMPVADHAIRRISIAPGAKYGLAATDDGKLYRFGLPAGTPAVVPADAPEQIVWSPAGRSAALRYPGGRLRVLSNLDSAAESGMEIALDASTTDVAVSDDGSVVLAITSRGAGALVTAFTAGEAHGLLNGPGLNRLAFFFGSTDAVVSDSAEGKVYVLRRSGEMGVLAQVVDPTAVSVSTDNKQVMVASATNAIATVRVFDGVVTSGECSCAVGVLERLDRDIFRVTGKSAGPMWLFNAAAVENRFTFVPQPETGRE
jgi:hypothetical protein